MLAVIDQWRPLYRPHTITLTSTRSLTVACVHYLSVCMSVRRAEKRTLSPASLTCAVTKQGGENYDVCKI